MMGSRRGIKEESPRSCFTSRELIKDSKRSAVVKALFFLVERAKMYRVRSTSSDVERAEVDEA